MATGFGAYLAQVSIKLSAFYSSPYFLLHVSFFSDTWYKLLFNFYYLCLFFLALDERGYWEQSGNFQGRGTGTDRTMSQSAVLPGCSFLQQSENSSWALSINIQETVCLVAFMFLCFLEAILLCYRIFFFALAWDCHCDWRRSWDSWTTVVGNKLGNCPYGQVGYVMCAIL